MKEQAEEGNFASVTKHAMAIESLTISTPAQHKAPFTILTTGKDSLPSTEWLKCGSYSLDLHALFVNELVTNSAKSALVEQAAQLTAHVDETGASRDSRRPGHRLSRTS